MPAQLAKTEPVAGAAVNVTAVPLLKVPEQVVEQLIPAGELVMVPLPVPALVTARVNVCTGAADAAADFRRYMWSCLLYYNA